MPRVSLPTRSGAQRSGRTLARASRTGGRVLVTMLAVSAASLFILWDADWWIVRDKVEHLRAALFGSYVTPDCRADPTDCENGQKVPKPERTTAAQMCADQPGLEIHCQFQELFAYFNTELFENRLPPAVITLQRKRGAAGYFSHRRFSRPDGETIDEIAMNPSTFGRASMLELASTLVHEMTHLEQAHFGAPGANGFHNAEWGRLMKRVGLHPSATGLFGAPETGVRMTHYIIPGGHFEQVAKAHPLIAGAIVAVVEGKRSHPRQERDK
ncbi:MAG: SprT-like domain-containing protein [Pseudomonadota bacterium]